MYRTIGMILFTLACGETPFDTEDEIRKGVYEFPDNREVSRGCKILIGKMLRIDPRRRIIIEEVLEDKYVK
jgi:serine/threonine protein kinase